MVDRRAERIQSRITMLLVMISMSAAVLSACSGEASRNHPEDTAVSNQADRENSPDGYVELLETDAPSASVKRIQFPAPDVLCCRVRDDGGAIVGIAFDPSYDAYYDEGSGTAAVFSIDTKSGEVQTLHVAESDDDLQSVDVSEDGRFVAFTTKGKFSSDDDGNRDTDIYLVDLDGDELTLISPTSGFDSWFLQGNRLAYALGNGSMAGLAIYDRNARREERLDVYTSARVSDDGLVVASRDSTDIIVFDAANGSRRTVASLGDEGGWLFAISGNGRFVALRSSLEDETGTFAEVTRLDLQRDEASKVGLEFDAGYLAPDLLLSDDGRYMAAIVTRVEEGGPYQRQLVLVDWKTGEYFSTSGVIYEFDLSSDGRFLAYGAGQSAFLYDREENHVYEFAPGIE